MCCEFEHWKDNHTNPIKSTDEQRVELPDVAWIAAVDCEEGNGNGNDEDDQDQPFVPTQLVSIVDDKDLHCRHDVDNQEVQDP